MVSRWIFLLGLWSLTGYFSYHAFHGERGYFAWQQKKVHASALQKELIQFQAVKQSLSRKISLIHTHIDLDLLEQLAWLLFRAIEPNKRVILCH